MTTHILKKSGEYSEQQSGQVTKVVAGILSDIRQHREAGAIDYSARLDNWKGDIVVTNEQIACAEAEVPQQLKDDIRYAQENIAKFAQAQRDSFSEIEVELRPGLVAGQRLIPMDCAGCYVPGGRYSHIASAMMTITTARVAGVQKIVACSPPRAGEGIPAAILYTMHICGADRILTMGGVQGVAAMAYGLFDAPPADILVGPGNQYVAEAKRQLFGRVGIDMFAGPTDSMVLADGTADARVVAWDLVGQAEHGDNSPVWLATDNGELAQQVETLIPELCASLPRPNQTAAENAWENLGEIVLCSSREEMAAYADLKAPEHLHVQAADLDWWQNRLSAYGSLFLGAETTVAFGDKASGPNHVLPTSGAARYTGGLSVQKFLKTVTWQRTNRDALRDLAQVTARISRYEGMEGHAQTADIRLKKYFPGEEFPLEVPEG
ncbi:MAG: histidinol dehydrogenase [Rhodobacteraceae bacterium]|nr:histidinol dehydrogenase [Paracoccaceae bacterium]